MPTSLAISIARSTRFQAKPAPEKPDNFPASRETGTSRRANRDRPLPASLPTAMALSGHSKWKLQAYPETLGTADQIRNIEPSMQCGDVRDQLPSAQRKMQVID